MTRLTARIDYTLYDLSHIETGELAMSLTELLMSFSAMSYEALLAALRDATLTVEQRERVVGELHSRDRAMHNQWVQVCGGQLK